MHVFDFRNRVISDYGAYIKSFISIRDTRIRERVETDLEGGLLWPEPRIGLNPAFAEGAWIDELVHRKVLHPECAKIFRIKPTAHDAGTGLKLHQHQLEAVHAAKRGHNYVLTTGTGSGKSLAYIVPIVDAILKRRLHKGIQLPAEAGGTAEGETAEDLARLKASFPTPRDAVAHIMDTFPIVKRKDEAKHGDYRTKRVILEIYNAMAEAIRTGHPYQTRLEPPPADPRGCHPPMRAPSLQSSRRFP